MEPMYRGIPFSPQTTLTATIGAADTVIPVADVSAFPDPPNYATIGIDADGETISYAAKTDNALSGCTRGVEGTPKSWASGSVIARNFTAKDLESLQKNLREVGRGAQSDWEVNDETNFAYVRGRTHWVERIGGDAIVPEQIVNITTSGRGPAGDFGETLVVGDKYDVVVDGVMYICVAKEHEGELVLGNTTLIGGPDWGSGEDTGEPFAFTQSHNGGPFIIWAEAGFARALTVSVVTARSVVYHKFDPGYLPDGVPYAKTAKVGQTIVVSEVDADGKPTRWEARDAGAGGGGGLVVVCDTGDGTANYSPDEIKEFFRSGKDVVFFGDEVDDAIVYQLRFLDPGTVIFETTAGSSETAIYYRRIYVQQDKRIFYGRDDVPTGGGTGGANFLLALSTNEADAQANSEAITAAIAEHKHVVLQRGDYPVKPGIVVESGKLDMNGARFHTVDYKSGTPLVYLRGESPEICNGELEGSYDLADNEAGYSFFEKECLICPEGVNDAYIHHMDLHNNWGYCISPGEVAEKVYINSGTAPSGVNDKKYFSDAISIPEGYKFITAAGGVGYNYIISVSPVAYYFYDANGAKILEAYGIPRKRHFIPAGAATVKILTHTNTDAVIPYNAYFTNYEETLVVSDCYFHNFHSLGMANMPGPTTVTRCSFVEGGKPRSDVYSTLRATVGGIDIEDIQTPELIMSDCWSRDSGKLLMFGGYKCVISNCTGGSIGVYRGWECDITNCNVAELYTMGSPCRISTNGVHADTINIKPGNVKDVRGNISTNKLISDASHLECFDNFTVKMSDVTSDVQGVLSGKLNGRIEGAGGTGFKIKGFSSEPGSRIEIDETLIPAANGNYYGTFKVTGDTYGLVSNAPFWPNGHTIHDSTFDIGAQMSAYGFADVTYSGGFKNCVFNLTGGTFFRLFAKSPAEPVELTFEGCTINNANYYLFNFIPFAGSKITFKNCTIADESKLFNGNTSGITIEFVSGGEGSVEIDASLTVEGRAADAKAVGEALAAKMPAATTAKVGQYFLVSAVDENGNVTAVEAVDVPNNDSESGLPLIAEVTLTEAVSNGLTIDKNSGGGAFSIKREFYVEGEVVPPAENPADYISLILNGAALTENQSVSKTETTYFYAHFWQSAPRRWEGYLITKAGKYHTPTAIGRGIGGVNFANWMGHNSQPTECTAFKLGHTNALGAGTKIWLYGK